jgi:hypothetical protein
VRTARSTLIAGRAIHGLQIAFLVAVERGHDDQLRRHLALRKKADGFHAAVQRFKLLRCQSCRHPIDECEKIAVVDARPVWVVIGRFKSRATRLDQLVQGAGYLPKSSGDLA